MKSIATTHQFYVSSGKVHTIGEPLKGSAQSAEVRQESDDLRNPADSAASGFYITNAYNSFIGNAASGGWSGFAFPNLMKPIGYSKEVEFVPERRKTLVSKDNPPPSC